MKRFWGILFLVIAINLLISCSNDVNATSNSKDKQSPSGVVSTVSYSKAKIQTGRYDTYESYVGTQDNSSANWAVYDQKLYLSSDGKSWSEIDGSFTVGRGVETFFLKPVTESLCNKDGTIYKCTSTSIYKSKERNKEDCFVVAIGPSCSDKIAGCTAEVSYSQTTATAYTFNYSAQIKITNPNDSTWTTTDQKLFISFNGQSWQECSNSGSFSVPRGTTTFYLKPVTVNMCNKDGSTFICTSTSIYKNTTRTDSQTFVLEQ